MPSLNVVDYIQECMESVVNQTLKDIEIICVDAGSTDGTLEILREYEEKDSRVKIILSDRKSYGYQMNLGMEAATGEYIGIVETDDYVAIDMFERLFITAKESDAEIVKANFSRFVGEKENRVFSRAHIASKLRYYNRLLNPQIDPKLLMEAFYTWAGIYRRDFLFKNNIRHNETPGASYQDNGFYFQTMSCAEKIYLIKDNLYFLRRDNPNSSINSKEKVFFVCDEYDFIYNFLRLDPERYQRFLNAFWINKFRAYYSTLNRIGPSYKLDFLKRFSEEFRRSLVNGEIDLKFFSHTDLDRYKRIVTDYEAYYYTNFFKEEEYPLPTSDKEKISFYFKLMKANEYQKLYYKRRYNATKNSTEYKLGSRLLYIPRKIRGGFRCVKENGFWYTINHTIDKIKKFKKGK